MLTAVSSRNKTGYQSQPISSLSSMHSWRPSRRIIGRHHGRHGSTGHQVHRGPLALRVLEPKNEEDLGGRLIASATYLLPLLDSLTFGRFIFTQFPFIARALTPLAPLNMLYHSFPLAPFLTFLAIYSGVANNSRFSRFVRYNACQAVLLDVLLVIPNILLTDVFKPPQDGLGFELYLQCFNTIFLYAIINVGLGMGGTLTGNTTRLPFVADAADSQVSRM